MKCKECGHEIEKRENLKIPEINIEVTPIKDYYGKYSEIKVPKGYKLIEIWQLTYILESEYSDKFLGDYKEKRSWFWCSQTKYAKENKLVFGAYLLRDGYWYAVGDVLSYSSGIGRVVFVKEID